MLRSLVGSEMCIRDRLETVPTLKSYFSPKKSRNTETIVASSPRVTSTEPKNRIAGKHSHTTSDDGTHQEQSHDTTTASNLKSYFSPKKAKTEKIVEGNSNRELPSSPNNSLHEEHSHSRSCKDTHILTCDDTTASPESWACSQCTYIHIGATKFDYLACEVCGSPRTIDTHDVAK